MNEWMMNALVCTLSFTVYTNKPYCRRRRKRHGSVLLLFDAAAAAAADDDDRGGGGSKYDYESRLTSP